MLKISVAVSISFENFDFVVATLNKAVGDWRRKRIQYSCQPILHCFCTLNKLRNSTIVCRVNPVGHSFFSWFSVFAIEDFQKVLFVKMSRTQIRRGIQHNIDLLFLFIGQFIKSFKRFRSAICCFNNRKIFCVTV